VLQTRNEATLAHRRPAQYGWEVVRRILVRFVFALVVLGGLPLFLLFVVGAPGYVVAPLALAAIATILWADPRVEHDLTWRVQGAVAEERVGAILEDLGVVPRLLPNTTDRWPVADAAVVPAGVVVDQPVRQGGRSRI